MRCPSGKRMYGNERVATRAVNVARDRGELPPLRHYLCPDCNHWHLARKRRPPMDVHALFGLSYANYLVLPRTVLQSMPEEWQHRFVAAVQEINETFPDLDYPVYDVRVLKREPEHIQDELCATCDEPYVAANVLRAALAKRDTPPTRGAVSAGAIERLAVLLAAEDGDSDDYRTNAGQARDYHQDRAERYAAVLRETVQNEPEAVGVDPATRGEVQHDLDEEDAK